MNPYPLDWKEQTVYVKENGVRCAHVVRRPTFEELNRRSQAMIVKSEDVDARASHSDFDDAGASLKLYDAILLQVSGYDFGDGVDPSSLRPVGDDQKAMLFADHKAAVIRALYNHSVERDALPSVAISLAKPTVRLRHDIGGGIEPQYQFWHVLQKPDEKTRKAFDQKYVQRLSIKGSRRNQAEARFNFRIAVETYDKLFVGLENVTVNDQPFTPEQQQQFLAALDPILKEQAVNELMKAVESDLSD